MQSFKPFKARNVRYDRAGNVVLLYEWEEVVITREENTRSLRASPAKRDESRSPQLSFSTRRPFGPPRSKRTFHFPFFSSIQSKLRTFGSHTNPRLRFLLASGRFAATFTAVFLFLFLSLNFGSFWQVVRATVFPNEGERIALEALVDGRGPHFATSRRQGYGRQEASRGKQRLTKSRLPPPPRLPQAGMSLGSIFDALSITPPDNRLIIPQMGKNIPIVAVSDAALRREDWETFEKDVQHTLRFGVVHYPGTAKPGEVGNVFITGHSSYYPWGPGKYKDVFALLGNLVPGDEYSIYYEGTLHRYRIAKKFEVSPRDVSVLDQPIDRRMSTLMTCTPLGTTIRRLILQADEIDPVTGEVVEVAEGAEGAEVKWGGELPV